MFSEAAKTFMFPPAGYEGSFLLMLTNMYYPTFGFCGYDVISSWFGFAFPRWLMNLNLFSGARWPFVRLVCRAVRSDQSQKFVVSFPYLD